MTMRYVLTDPAGREVARAEHAGILIDAAVARLTVTDLWRDDEEWRVSYEITTTWARPRRVLRYGISRRGGVYGIDGSGVPATVAASLPLYLATKIDADDEGAVDPKDPDYERKVTP